MIVILFLLAYIKNLAQPPLDGSLDVLEMFAGDEAISNACRGKNLDVRAFDIKQGAYMDILSPAGFAHHTFN